jgi:hypothetical protein
MTSQVRPSRGGGPAAASQSPVGIASAAAGLALAGLLSACGPPQEARITASEHVRALPSPTLEPTSHFDVPLRETSSSADELLAEAEALRGRADALRARAQALSQPAPEESLP